MNQTSQEQQKNTISGNSRSALIGRNIGMGSFGRIYEITDNKGVKMAVKAIKHGKDGPPDLIEASIMSTYNHPGLARSIRVSIDGEIMYIVQEIATSDLSQFTRGNGTSEPVLRSWSNTICQGVLCLHQENIIHCDIKSSNILRYANNTVRLSDFTLATVMTNRNDLFKHSICTITHRPPECLLGLPWSSSVDIWSLGCTLYEIATGQFLFPYQGEDDGTKTRVRIPSKTMKTIIATRTLDCILDWLSRNGDPDLGGYYRPPTQVKNFIPSAFNDKWYSLSSEFRTLVMSMLRFEPRNRPTIETILLNPYFKDIPLWSCTISSTPFVKIPPQENYLIQRTLASYNVSEQVESKTKEIYGRCLKMNGIRDMDLVMASFWIASKIIDGIPPRNIRYAKHQIIAKEREICKYLKFRLHIAAMEGFIQKSSNS